jgi:hypothetical protein
MIYQEQLIKVYERQIIVIIRIILWVVQIALKLVTIPQPGLERKWAQAPTWTRLY